MFAVLSQIGDHILDLVRLGQLEGHLGSVDHVLRRRQILRKRLGVPDEAVRARFLETLRIFLLEVLDRTGGAPKDAVEMRADLVLAFDVMAGLAFLEDLFATGGALKPKKGIS